jgi:hypothetical protein
MSLLVPNYPPFPNSCAKPVINVVEQNEGDSATLTLKLANNRPQNTIKGGTSLSAFSAK